MTIPLARLVVEQAVHRGIRAQAWRRLHGYAWHEVGRAARRARRRWHPQLETIHRRRAEGATLRQIGLEVGLSYERVRQLLWRPLRDRDVLIAPNPFAYGVPGPLGGFEP